MKLHEALLGGLICGLGLWMILYSGGLPKPRHLQYGPGLFPTLIGGGLMICGGIQAIFGIARWRNEPLIARPDWLRDRRLLVNVAAIPLACLFYYLTARKLGFVTSGVLILFAMLMIGGVRPLRALLVSLLLIVVTTLLFVSILHVPLDWGLLAPVAGWFIW